MPKNKDEIDPGVPQLVKSFFDQFAANAFRLGFRQNRQRGQQPN